MKLKTLLISVLILALVVVVVPQAIKELKALLTGYEEVPSVSTTGNGELRARISKDESSISYELSYSDLEGAVTQAHIHLGQAGANGGISVWLCGNNPPTSPPPGTQACPAPPATITGTITAGDVVGPTNQGIAPGEFGELIRAIRAGKTYVNIHSTKFPGGEVRSQIDPGKGNHH
ncbi:MAG TPA: CHRD domain-containing protein [Pyrinomonadaceae bacterium]|nr:CHRD domain-containing protein [Pyrinomonadaceae bacterium]